MVLHLIIYKKSLFKYEKKKLPETMNRPKKYKKTIMYKNKKLIKQKFI